MCLVASYPGFLMFFNAWHCEKSQEDQVNFVMYLLCICLQWFQHPRNMRIPAHSIGSDHYHPHYAQPEFMLMVVVATGYPLRGQVSEHFHDNPSRNGGRYVIIMSQNRSGLPNVSRMQWITWVWGYVFCTNLLDHKCCNTTVAMISCSVNSCVSEVVCDQSIRWIVFNHLLQDSTSTVMNNNMVSGSVYSTWWLTYALDPSLAASMNGL